VLHTALAQLAPDGADAIHEVRLGLDYFGQNASRMRYPEFAAAGLPLGSGMVEGACKQVLEARWGRRYALATERCPSGGQPSRHSPLWRVARFWARQPHIRRSTARSLRGAA